MIRLDSGGEQVSWRRWWKIIPSGAVGVEAEEQEVCSWVYGEWKGGESM